MVYILRSSMKINVKYATRLGAAVRCDALDVLPLIPDNSVNLILTSPPFPLRKKKAYGNVAGEDYIPWFLKFAKEFKRILAHDGSLVVEFGGGWNKGEPTRSIYQYKLLVEMCEGLSFNLAQEFYWYNPAKLPTPAQWVTIERIRVKEAVTCIWWLSKGPRPKANNRKVLKPYSASMQDLFKNGYNQGPRPSGHNISSKFGTDNGGAIPPNLIIRSNTASSDKYQRGCREADLPPHPARFPDNLPGFFIEFLTDPGDVVLDPFGGSNLTGHAAEVLKRQWIALEVMQEYIDGSKTRFDKKTMLKARDRTNPVIRRLLTASKRGKKVRPGTGDS